MAGQIETNATVTKIKAKNAELTSAAADGKAKLADATSKIAEINTEMTALAPKLPEVPSIQGELSKLGSLNAAGLVSKISAIVTQYGSAIPGLSSLLGTMGLSSFPPTIDVSSIMDQIPNVEEVDGALVTAPAESLVAEEEPAKPIVKEVVEIDYKEISLAILKKEFKASRKDMLAVVETHKRPHHPIAYVYAYTWWESLGNQVGASVKELRKYVSAGRKSKSDRYTALYTVADSNMVFKGVKAGYIKSKGEHLESADLLDFADVCNYWWEKKQKNV